MFEIHDFFFIGNEGSTSVHIRPDFALAGEYKSQQERVNTSPQQIW